MEEKIGDMMCMCVYVCVRFAVIVCSTRIHSDRFTFGWLFFRVTKEFTNGLSSIYRFVGYCSVYFFLSPFICVDEWMYVCVCLCHRWLHLNWIKSTIWKSSDSCCIIWGGIPLILNIFFLLPRCRYTDATHFMYSSNLLFFFSWIPPEITFTLFYLWRSRFFSLSFQCCWCWCWRRCCCYHYLWFFTALFYFILCVFTLFSAPKHAHTHKWLFPSFVCYLFPFFGFLHSLVQCTV